MRWSIEVAFHECKGLLNLGKCQCRDFASQYAARVTTPPAAAILAATGVTYRN